MEIESYVNEIATKHRNELDQVILTKLNAIQSKASKDGEKILSGLLLDVLKAQRPSHYRKAVERLTECGYEIMVEEPEPVYNFESEGSCKVSIDFGEVKVKIRKTIYEV